MIKRSQRTVASFGVTFCIIGACAAREIVSPDGGTLNQPPLVSEGLCAQLASRVYDLTAQAETALIPVEVYYEALETAHRFQSLDCVAFSPREAPTVAQDRSAIATVL